jgi:hypothetical protein
MLAEIISQVKRSTLNQFQADLDKQMIDIPVLSGTVMELNSPRVFEELVKLEGRGSVRELGNMSNWTMSGRDAALDIAAHRLWALPEFQCLEFNDCRRLVAD